MKSPWDDPSVTARFRYRAADAQGQVIEGDMESLSRRAAIEDLRRQRLFPVDVEEVGAPAAVPQRRETIPAGQALALWTRTIATMLAAGVPLERSLAFSSAQAGNAALSAAVIEVRKDVQSGSSLAAALRRRPGVFGPLYVAMVSAGEESGALDQVMSRLADYLDEAAELRARLRSALLYPALMAIVASIGVTVILLFVVPRFAAMLSDIGGSLPLSTRLLMAMSSAVVKWWFVWIPVVALAVYGAQRLLSVDENRRAWHRFRLGLPVTGDLERNIATARFVRTLGLLLRSGVGIIPSLRIARSSVANIALGEAIERAASAVTQGKRLAPELHGIVPPMAEQLIAVGEESGQLDELCLRAADAYDRETGRRMRTLIGLIEPALILLFGLLVGFVALAMLQAIYSVNAQVM